MHPKSPRLQLSQKPVKGDPSFFARNRAAVRRLRAIFRAAEIGVTGQERSLAAVPGVREAKGNTLGNRKLFYGAFSIYISSQPFKSKVDRDGRNDEGGGGEVGEMLCQELNPVLCNSLCTDISKFLELREIPIHDPERGVLQGAEQGGGSLSEMTRSDDNDRFAFLIFRCRCLSFFREDRLRYVRAGRKPGSVSPGSHRVNREKMTIPLVPMSPSGSSDLPGNLGGPPSAFPYLVLLRVGFS